MVFEAEYYLPDVAGVKLSIAIARLRCLVEWNGIVE